MELLKYVSGDQGQYPVLRAVPDKRYSLVALWCCQTTKSQVNSHASAPQGNAANLSTRHRSQDCRAGAVGKVRAQAEVGEPWRR